MIFTDILNFKEEVTKTTNKPTFLGVDFGGKKIGTAILNTEVGVAMPYKTLANSIDELVTQIQYIEPDGILIGASFSYEAALKEIQRFAAKLQARITQPIFLQDESYSTSIANNMLKDLGLKRKKRNQIDDVIAAQLICDWFYENFCNSTSIEPDA
jgi:putative Holliday junction resolvase